MTVLDPGHKFRLATLDVRWWHRLLMPWRVRPVLRFVKRVGAKFPGNDSAYPGTTIQEVLRAVVFRIDYLQGQIPDSRNTDAIHHIKMAIWDLECRAADRHKRPYPSFEEAFFGAQCCNCLHVGCIGNCAGIARLELR